VRSYDMAVCAPLSVITIIVNWLHSTANSVIILHLSVSEEQFQKKKKSPVETYEPTRLQAYFVAASKQFKISFHYVREFCTRD
jgi:hypothetical protein